MARIKAGRMSGEHMQPKDSIFSYFFLTKRYGNSSLFAICLVPVILSAIYCRDHTIPAEEYIGEEASEC